MQDNRSPSQITLWLAVLLFTWTQSARVAAAPPANQSDEIASIVSQLDTDAIQASNRLLTLCDQFDRNGNRLEPSIVHTLILSARTLGRQGHWQESISLLQRAHSAVASADPSVEAADAAPLHTIDLAIASAAMRCSAWDLATTHCTAVIDDPQSPSQHRSAAYPMLIKSHQAASRIDQAIDVLQRATTVESVNVASPQLAEAALALGSTCLELKNASAAKFAYQAYLRIAPEGPKTVDATLGEAWAAALGSETPEIASEKLLSFAKQFPQHRDAPHSLRASASCLDQANQAEQAERIRQQLFETYPESDASIALLDWYAQSGRPWPPMVREIWKARLNSENLPASQIQVHQLVYVLTESLSSSDDQLWQATVAWLVARDADGHQTEQILILSESKKQDSLAEHLSVDLIARAEGTADRESPAASESACRWAGKNERWTMLALAADELGPPSESSRRSMSIDRILAESLMQTQRPAKAMPWWDWLIDHRQSDDFATLLRGAETSVAYGEIDVATKRIEVARKAAGDVAFHRELTRLLTAELSIRRARFDEARETLLEIVRASDGSPALRPRAQWLVGETYFLQQRFADAIDAYRQVDSMDQAGQWAPAALLQAGKAFEKLGRSREAATCYTALLTRFRDWPHVTTAQTRLAALRPTASDADPGSILR